VLDYEDKKATWETQASSNMEVKLEFYPAKSNYYKRKEFLFILPVTFLSLERKNVL